MVYLEPPIEHSDELTYIQDIANWMTEVATTKQDGRKPPPTRPYFVFMPPQLVAQFTEEAIEISSLWRIVVFADTSSFQKLKIMHHIRSLSRHDYWFDPNDLMNGRTLFIISTSMYDAYLGVS